MKTRAPFTFACLAVLALACHTRTIDGSQRAFGAPAAHRPASVAVLGDDFDADALVSAEPGGEHDHHAHGDAAGDAVVYTCPHHPDVRASAPGKCPKCAMDLVPAKPAATP